MNEMYQSSMLRDGPSGNTIIALRNKLLSPGSIDLTEVERGFLLFSLQDTFQSSQSPFVTSQLGNQMRVLGERNTKTVSSIDEINSPTQDEEVGTYLTQWEVIQSCMTKLGLSAPPPYQPLSVGPTGDPFGESVKHSDVSARAWPSDKPVPGG